MVYNDLISRQKAINIIKFYMDTSKRESADVLGFQSIVDSTCEICMELLNGISSEPLPTNWISVQSLLPEIGDKVLVSTERTCSTMIFKGVVEDDKEKWVDNKSYKKVKAWMYLPPTYDER